MTNLVKVFVIENIASAALNRYYGGSVATPNRTVEYDFVNSIKFASEQLAEDVINEFSSIGTMALAIVPVYMEASSVEFVPEGS